MLLGVPAVDAAECAAAATYGAIQDCINSSNPGDTIRIAAGTADLDSMQTIVVPNAKLGVRLVGAGVGATIIHGMDSNEALIEVGEPGEMSSGATVIEHITFDGFTPTGPAGRGIRVMSNGLSPAEPAIVRHCEFKGFNNGVTFYSELNPRDWMIGPDNVFDHSAKGVNLNQADDIVIAGNVFRGYDAGVRTISTYASTGIEIVGNRFEGGVYFPVPPMYYGVFLTGTSSSDVPKNWTIRDNLIAGATVGISMILGGGGSPNLDGVVISGNCLDDNTTLGSQAPPPPTADINNPTHLPVSAPNNFGGTADPKPIALGQVTVTPWLTDIAYTGAAEIPPGDRVILEATVHNSDGAATGPASGVLVRFFRTPAGGGTPASMGVGVTDAEGRAAIEAGSWDVGTYTVEAKAAGGCLAATATVGVRQVSTTVYDGETYATWSPTTPVWVSATVWPPASSTISCSGPQNPGPVSFVATPISGGPVVSVSGVRLLPAVPPSPARSTGSVPMTLLPGVYLMSVNYAGGRTCLPSADAAVVVVAAPGGSANGGGWYRVDAFAPPRVNFGFTVQKVMSGGQIAGYKGQLLWMNNNKWRLKGVVDADASAYWTFPCPSWAGYAGASNNPVCAAFRGSGLLETWDATGMQWLPAVAYGNNGAVTFTATAYDGGQASLCKRKACVSGDIADYFGIQVDPVPGSVLPESPPLLLMGGSIKAQ